MRTWVAAAIASFSLLAAGCGASPPAHFEAGGAGVDIATGAWARVAGNVVVGADGLVTVDGERAFTIDKSGRIRDYQGAPFALVEQGGRLVGRDEKGLGMLHSTSIESSSGRLAVSVAPNGEITIKDRQGTRPGGAWTGDCMKSPSAQSFCTLVAYLVTMDDLVRQGKIQEEALRRVNRVH
jgi:hypothetical protein